MYEGPYEYLGLPTLFIENSGYDLSTNAWRLASTGAATIALGQQVLFTKI